MVNASLDNATQISTLVEGDGLTDKDKQRLFNYALYFVQGVYIFVANFLIVAAIMAYKKMRKRKEYVIMAALALADALAGVTYMAAAIYRIPLILTGKHTAKVNNWYCMTRFHAVMFVYAVPSVGMMLFLVSVDRLLAIAMPLRYFHFDAAYAYKLSGVFYTGAFTSGTVLVLVSYMQQPRADKYGALCGVSSAMGNANSREYYYGVRAVFGTGSIVLYLLIPFLFRRYIKKVNEGKKQSDREKERQIKQQKRITVTLGLSALFTFVFYVIPNLTRVLLVDYIPIHIFNFISPFLDVMNNINAMLNIILYVSRHADIRMAMLSVLMLKRQPMQEKTTAAVTQATTETVNTGQA